MKTILIFTVLTLVSHLARNEVPVWGQCGGINYEGETICDSSSNCQEVNSWYSQCKPKPNDPNKVNEWGQCGGLNYNGNSLCQSWLTCVKKDDWYWQCLKSNTKKTTNPSKPTTTKIKFKPTSSEFKTKSTTKYPKTNLITQKLISLKFTNSSHSSYRYKVNETLNEFKSSYVVLSFKILIMFFCFVLLIFSLCAVFKIFNKKRSKSYRSVSKL